MGFTFFHGIFQKTRWKSSCRGLGVFVLDWAVVTSSNDNIPLAAAALCTTTYLDSTSTVVQLGSRGFLDQKIQN